MNPLRIAAWAVQLVCDLFAPVEKMHPWPASEQPLIDDPPLQRPRLDDVGYLDVRQQLARHDTLATVEPMPGWFRGGDEYAESSAVSGSTSLAGVDPYAEGPTPGATHHPGVGQPKVTASLRISAAIGLRDYAASEACEAPVYWRNIADQLDPK